MINVLCSDSFWYEFVPCAASLLMFLPVIPLLVLPWFYKKKVVLYIQSVLLVLSIICFIYIAFDPSLIRGPSGFFDQWGVKGPGVPAVWAWLLRLSGLVFGFASLAISVVFAFRKKGVKQLRWLYIILVIYLGIALTVYYIIVDASALRIA